MNDPVLGEMVRRLVEAYQPERIYLFGSKARGEAGPDSDYHLLVVVSESGEPPYRRAQRHLNLSGRPVADTGKENNPNKSSAPRQNE